MTLTNYWWLLIWLFLGGAIFGRMPKRRERLNGEIVERWDVFSAIMMVLPYIIWAGFRGDVSDTYSYRRTFLAISPELSQIPAFFINDTKDPGFSALMVLLKNIIGNQDKLFFLIIAIFQIGSLTLVFRKYSPNFWLSLFMFVVSTDYLSWVHNGMRQFIAVTIIFAGFGYVVKKQYIQMIALILLASMIHGSALLMLPIIFVVQGRVWNKGTILMLIATAGAVAFVDRFTPILNSLLQDTQYNDMIGNEIWAVDDGTNILRVAFYSLPAVLSLLGLKYIQANDDRVMNICVNYSIVTTALYLVASVSSGVYIGRLPIYTTLPGYIAMPWMIDQIFEPRSAQLIRCGVCTLYMAFFYYQLHFAWGVL